MVEQFVAWLIGVITGAACAVILYYFFKEDK